MLLRSVARGLAFGLLMASSWAFAEPPMHVEATAQQADGKILVAGEDSTASPRSITVGRLNADGTLDATFGGGWVQFTPPSFPSQLKVTAVGAQDDGGVLVVAQHDNAILLVKFAASGGVDPAFGIYGGFTIDDYYMAGVRINAVVASSISANTVFGFGSANNVATGNVLRPFAVKYVNGVRDTSADTVLPVVGEFRAATRTYSGFAAGGYTSGASKSMLVAIFDNLGRLDTGSSRFNHAGYGTFEGGGYNYEGFGIASDDGNGDILLVGRDGHSIGGVPASNMVLVYFAWNGTYLQYRVTFTTDDAHQLWGDATAMSIARIAGSPDWLMAGTVVEPSTGRAYFGYARLPGIGSYTQGWMRLGPRTADDHLLVAAYPSGPSFVAVGTREAATGGEFALRLRYFADNGDFDTDFASASPDTTPNPIAFSASSYDNVGPAQQFYEIVRVTGIDAPAAISVQGGAYTLSNEPNGCDFGAVGTAPGTVTNGQYVCFLITAASTPSTTINAVVTVGGVQSSLAVTTGSLPETTLTGTPPNPSGGSVTFGWIVNPASNSNSSECRLDGAAFAPCQSNTFSNLAEGQHTFEVRGVNEWGPDPTPASFTWTVQLPPDTTITSGPPSRSNLRAPTFTFTASRAGATFECSLNAAAFTACTSGQSFPGLSEGSQWLRVRATDAAGADASPAEWRWTTDFTLPTVQLFASGTGIVSYTTSTTATFSFSVNDVGGAGVVAQCQLDGSAFAGCTSPFTQGGLAEGNHVFGVRALDTAGNSSAVSTHAWTIDFTPPDTVITSGPSGITASTSATFGFASDAGATFECQLDGGAWTACSNPVTFTTLAQGAHSVAVRARDPAGNTDSTPASASWTVDTVAPDVSITGAPPFLTSSTTATFTFQSTDATATFECGFDTVTYSPCVSPATYSNLAAGNHSFTVRSRDAAGNVSGGIGQMWTVDTTPGDTTITSGPAQPSAVSNAMFTFTATEPGSTFECRLDGAAWSACPTSMPYNEVPDGSHTFEVRSKDPAGNLDPTPASYTWVIDTTPPIATVTSGPSQWTSQTSVTFTFTSNKPNSTFLCHGPLDPDGPATPCSSPITYTGFTQQANYTFVLYAVDASGRRQTYPTFYEWNFDNVAPDTLISSGPQALSASPAATFTFSANEPSTTFECSLDLAAFAACASPTDYSALADGSHTFRVRAIDRAGLVDGTPSSLTWTIDTVPPETAITSAPSGTGTSTSASITFSSEGGATFECALDAAAFAACSSPASLTSLADGSHTFRVRAKDAAGNVDPTPASATWTVDTLPPETTITASPPAATNSRNATFSFASSEAGSTFQCKLDGAAFAACSSPVAYTSLSVASHTFQVRATDALGHQDASPAAFTWVIDTTAPNTTITSGPSGSNNPSTATFTFTSSEAGSTFECKLDTGAFQACVSGVTYTGLPAGSHTLQVRAIDPAGNVDASPASRNWKSV
jgi:hypothetical protein